MVTAFRMLRLTLSAVNAMVVAGTVVLVLWASSSEEAKTSAVMERRMASSVAGAGALPDSGQPLPDIDASLWDIPLQRPLIDVEKAKKKIPRPRPPARPAPQVRLLGTIIESGRSFAVLLSAGRRIEVRQEGDTLEWIQPALRVLTIESDAVTLGDDKQKTTLRLPKGNVH